MRIALFYYSATGNTKLICEHFGNKLPEIEIIDISKKTTFSIEEYDVIGVAVPVFYLNIPPIVSDFLDSLRTENEKPAFLLISYGVMPGRSMRILGKSLRKKGFRIFDYFALRMPESFPPFIDKGLSDVHAPSPQEIQLLNDFIESLKSKIKRMLSGAEANTKAKIKKITTGFFNTIIPVPSNKKNLKKFGSLIVDEHICVSCGKCQQSCVYHAISYNKNPSFDMKKCNACYSCYNTCPQKAIFTTKISSYAQYQKTAINLKEKFI